jgi:hypothetical protein
MLNFFNDHYSKMKLELGIGEDFGIEEDEPKLEEVQKLLRGNTDASNFKVLLRKEQ